MTGHASYIDHGPGARVRRRKVFYLPGYDPIAPRRYRELYRKQGRKQAAISGYDFEMHAAKADRKAYRWHAQTTTNGRVAQAEIEFLIWNDIVQKSMKRSIFATYVLMWRTLWIYMKSRTLSALVRLRWRPMIAALYPVFMLNMQLFISWGAGAIVALPFDGLTEKLVTLAVMVAGLMLFRKYDRYFYAYYLLHDFAFSAQFEGRTPAELRPRIAEFARRIGVALDGPYDEVLVIGHSSGAHLGVEVLAKLFTERDVPERQRLAFLTLGQVIPMVSFLPEAKEMRRDLNMLARREDLTWVDVTALTDGACFALCDPVAVSGANPPAEEKTGPTVISAAYHNTLSPETMAAIRRKFFRLHTQYLYAFDRPADYDYFQITAGPVSLKGRFGGRKSSASTTAEVSTRHRVF